jgi:hypothetical protein
VKLDARAVTWAVRAKLPELNETDRAMNSKPAAPPAVRAYLAEIGRQGGKSTSPAKVKASKANAKKGGWPKGRPRKPK